jgi:large subunit ribosomal protein L21
MSYAIISVGGKQYRVREGERLLVDRLDTAEGKTFTPAVLLVGGDGEPQLAPKDVTVTARVLGATRGPKIRIGKYRQRTGYRRHTGFRAALTQIEIESIGAAKPARASRAKAESASEEKPKPTTAKPRAAAKPKPAAADEPAAATKPTAPRKSKEDEG